jgi:cytochrome b6-f complex iron-sulfur subunit
VSDLCRRTVLKGAAATCGAGLLAACGGGPSGDASTGGEGGSLVLLSEVPVGGAVSVRATDGSTVLVTQPRKGEAVAFSAVCTHQGCTVRPDGEGFGCPCHGSRFTLSGEVERGPADAPLRPFAVQVSDGQVLPA